MRRTQPNRTTMRALALGTLLLLLVVGGGRANAWTDDSISPSVAGLFIGETKIVEGAVTAADRDNNVVRLHLGKAPQDLLVSLVIGLLNDFPPAPETYYAGKTVRVAGTLRSFRGIPEIVLHDAGNIQVMDNNAPSAPPSVASAPPVAAPAPAAVAPARVASSTQSASETSQPPAPATVDARIDALLTRVQQLEERVRQLEDSRSAH